MKSKNYSLKKSIFRYGKNIDIHYYYYPNILWYDCSRRCCAGICYTSIIIDRANAKLNNSVFIMTWGACFMPVPVVLVYRGSGHQALYTYNVEPGLIRGLESKQKIGIVIWLARHFPDYTHIPNVEFLRNQKSCTALTLSIMSNLYHKFPCKCWKYLTWLNYNIWWIISILWCRLI